MKMKHLLLILAAAALLVACDKVDARYDAPNGVNKEMTLFSEEFSLPLGSLAPITLRDALNRIGAIAGLIKTDKEGYLLLSGDAEIASWPALDIYSMIDEPDQPYVFEPDPESTGLPLVPMMLTMFGFHCPDQSYVFTANSPLDATVPLTATVGVGDYYETFQEVRVKEFELKQGSKRFAEISLPGVLESEPAMVSLSDVKLYLPANILETLDDPGNTSFSVSYKFKSRLGLADYLDFPFNYTLQNLQLPIGKYKFHEVTVNLEVESTLPVEATVESIHLVDSDEVADENIVFTENLVIAGGSLNQPVTTPLTLTVKAQEGTIPDIGNIALSLRFSASPDFVGEPISASQGIAIKSSGITLRGGITLFGNEN